jgi:hypothetical protein
LDDGFERHECKRADERLPEDRLPRPRPVVERRAYGARHATFLRVAARELLADLGGLPVEEHRRVRLLERKDAEDLDECVEDGRAPEHPAPGRELCDPRARNGADDGAEELEITKVSLSYQGYARCWTHGSQ